MAQATLQKSATNVQPAESVSAADAAIGAAFIASGIGCTVMGLLTTAADISKPLSDSLNWYKPVGPLAGKTSVAVIVYLVSWALLHFGVKNVKLQTAFTIALVLIGLGFALTFPPVFDLIKGIFVK